MSGKTTKAALAGVCLALSFGLFLAACAPRGAGIAAPVSSGSGGAKGDGGGQPVAQPSFSKYSDIPLPGGAEIDVEKTLVFGTGENWIGQLVLNSSFGAFDMFDFFKQKMPKFGWREITSVRSATSVLTYSRQSRIATIQIKGKSLGGSVSTITVSPRRQEAAPAGVPPGPEPPNLGVSRSP
jgi:hypothetical protein